MQSTIKQITLAFFTWAMLCSTANADALRIFETHLAAGNAAGVEALIQKLDEENVVSGNTRNGHVRQIFEQFITTKPEIAELLIDWKERAPDSLYRKTAYAWHLSHLAWVARGSDISRNTHPKAFEQMHSFMQTSSDLVWEVFKQRNDFVPASDLIAQSYLHNHSEWSMDDFANIALSANPSPYLLDKIVYAANPKWGGSWDGISYFCETYAEKMVTPEWYTTDGCKVKAIYDSSPVGCAKTRPA
jgi:hypothetical protein